MGRSHVTSGAPDNPLHAELHRQFLLDVASWLTQQLDLAQLRREVNANRDVADRWRADFRDFCDAASADHACWAFRSPADTWNQLAGRAGYALTVDGRVTNVIMTEVS